MPSNHASYRLLHYIVHPKNELLKHILIIFPKFYLRYHYLFVKTLNSPKGFKRKLSVKLVTHQIDTLLWSNLMVLGNLVEPIEKGTSWGGYGCLFSRVGGYYILDRVNMNREWVPQTSRSPEESSSKFTESSSEIMWVS